MSYDYDACVECTVNVEVRAEVARYTVHVDIGKVCAAFFDTCI